MRTRPVRIPLGDLLLRAGLVDADGLARALERQRAQPGRLGTHLLRLGLVSEEDLAKVLSMQWNVPPFLSSLDAVEPAALARVPEGLARRLRALPMAWEPARSTLQVALTDPHDLSTIDEVRFASGARKVLVRVAPEAVIDRLLGHHYGGEPALEPVATEISLPSLGPSPLTVGSPSRPAASTTNRRAREAAVADPDPRRRRALASLLEAHGYRVTRASTPQEASALADRPGIESVWLHESWKDEVRGGSAALRLYGDPVAALEGALVTAGVLRREALALAEACAARILGEAFEPAKKAVLLVRFLAGRRAIEEVGLDCLVLRAWNAALDGWPEEPVGIPLPGDEIVAAVTVYERSLARGRDPAQALEDLRAAPSLDPDAVTSLIRWVAGENLLTRWEATRRLLSLLPEGWEPLTSHLEATGWQVERAAPGPVPTERLLDTWDAILATMAAGLPVLEDLSKAPADRRPPVFLLTADAAAPDTMYALRLGAEDVLPIGIHPEVLETKLHRAAARRAPERGYITGNLRDMSLADTLQILSGGGKTAVVSIEGPEGIGQVAVDQGRVVDARAPGLIGEEALYQMIRWTEGGFRIAPGQTVDAVTVEGSTEGLLMEGFRRLDEDRRADQGSRSDEVPDLG
ncbi:MAG: DUF4388 domain-containing protein [Deltaproteobacteria bacterium]|nr:DUF4388 domain-containing protein [Deltaproteobacteria bacterium]